MRYSLSFLIVFIFFTGCATKQYESKTELLKEQNTTATTTTTNTTELLKEQNTTTTNTTEDQFMSEFDDEYEDQYDENGTNKEADKCPSLDQYNRAITSFNDSFYLNFMTPLSDGYKNITNEGIRDSVGNFFYNIRYPVRAINNLLQLKFKNTIEETGVFLINSTVGLLGLFTPAQSYFNLKSHKEDFGQTLGYYGVPAGCHIVLPILGPSNMRDVVGVYVDYYADPLNPQYDLVYNTEDYMGLRVFEEINNSPKKLKEYYLLKQDSYDLFPYLRNIYEQFRYNEIQK